jgi:predicted Rossmann fold nucleotide-binding protein DprA/Smf involved in DNA uptake
VRDFVHALPPGTIVVSGGARGVDSWAEDAAIERGLEIVVFRADWDRYGNRAGPLRNAEIVAHSDRVIAFWDGKSRGTLNTILMAHSRGLPISVYDAKGAPVPLETAIATAQSLGVVTSQRKGMEAPPPTQRRRDAKAKRK